MPTPVESPWLNVAEAAEYSKRTPHYIRAAMYAGRLRGCQPMRKGMWLIHRDDLDAWIRGDMRSADVIEAS